MPDPTYLPKAPALYAGLGFLLVEVVILLYVYNVNGSSEPSAQRKAAGEVVRTLLAEPTAQGLFPEHPIPGTKKPVRWMSCDSSAGFEYLLGRVNRKVRICLPVVFPQVRTPADY